MDGLRFDAVHAIEDKSRPDILEEIAETVRSRLPSHRYVHLILENDKNQARYLARADQGRPRHYVAQWNDDIHHAMHVLLTGEERGYYADYADNPARHLARCLTEGFAYQNDPSEFRAGERRGEASKHLPPTAFVSFLQNHDQIGNRAFGDRLTALAPPEAVRAGLALLLLAPSPPLLFMGEEWASTRPFLFFCDLGESLREAVRDGRRKEFASFPEFADPKARERIPDPTAEGTFTASKLDWASKERSPHREALAETRRLLALRREEITPGLAGMSGYAGRIEWIEGASLSVAWRMGDGASLTVVANLAPTPAPVPNAAPLPKGKALYSTVPMPTSKVLDRLQPWTVMWFLERGDRLQARL
jgi:malto-oligosyltrehalose trehalohydrolase